MTKRVMVLSIMLALLALMLVGCSGGSYAVKVGTLNSSDNTINGNYSSFSGYYFKQVHFKQGETVEFHMAVNTESGKLAAKLIDSSGATVVALGTDKDTTLKIQKTGSYKVQVDAEKHHGSFLISWNPRTD